MKLCRSCIDYACRLAHHTRIVTDAELANPAFICDFRDFTSGLNIHVDDWIDYLCDLYRDYNGFISDAEGNLVSLNTALLEVYREWYRDWVNTPVRVGVMPRLRVEAKARVRVLATIVKTSFPEEAELWGRGAVNDNEGAKAITIKS